MKIYPTFALFSRHCKFESWWYHSYAWSQVREQNRRAHFLATVNHSNVSQSGASVSSRMQNTINNTFTDVAPDHAALTATWKDALSGFTCLRGSTCQPSHLHVPRDGGELNGGGQNWGENGSLSKCYISKTIHNNLGTLSVFQPRSYVTDFATWLRTWYTTALVKIIWFDYYFDARSGLSWACAHVYRRKETGQTALVYLPFYKQMHRLPRCWFWLLHQTKWVYS